MMPSISLSSRTADRKILSILIPVIIENGLMTLSSMILTAFIGRLPVMDMNAYGLSNRIYNIYGALIRGLAAAVLILLAKEISGKDRRSLHHMIQESYMEIGFCSVLLSVMILCCSSAFLSLMTDDPALLVSGKQLLRETVWFYPLYALVRLNASAFQAKGNTRTPMIIAAAGNLVSMISGYIWIFGAGPFAGYGIHGAALAQNLSLIVMFILGLYLLYGRHGEYEGAFDNWKMQDFSGTARLVHLGIPAAAEDVSWQLAAAAVSGMILSYGQEYYAAYQLGLQAEGFCDTMSAGFLTASLSLSSSCEGKERQFLKKRLRYFCRIIIAITSAYLLIGSEKVLFLLTDKAELVHIAKGYLFCMILSQYATHMQRISNGFLKSAGNAGETMKIHLIGLWLIRVPLVFLFAHVLKTNIHMIWHAFNADLWIRYILMEGSLKKHVEAHRSETMFHHTAVQY